MGKISRGKIVAMVICASLLLAVFVIGEVGAPGDAGVVAAPDLVRVSPGDNFTLTINATNVDSMGVWQVVLKYNATVMNVTSLWIPVDNVFGDPAVYQQQRVEPIYGTDFLDGLGYVGYGNSRFVGEVGVINGVLFMANCTALAEGETTITVTSRSNSVHIGPRDADILYTFLATWSDQYQEYREIPQSLTVKSVVMTSGAGVASRPVALFTVTPSIPDTTGHLVLPGHKPTGDTDFAQGYTTYPIVFNASASIGMMTLDNGTQVLSSSGIATYHWDFGDGATNTTNNPIIEHTYGNTGSWTATLSVEDKMNPPETSDTTQKLMVIGLVLDYFNWAPIIYTIFALIAAGFVFLIYREIRGYIRSKRMINERRLASKRTSSPSQQGT
jgi:hypothetical protein